jgi:hypothetical protein
MGKIVVFAVAFVTVTSIAVGQTRGEYTAGGGEPDYDSRDVTLIQTWDYNQSDAAFGLGIKYEGVGAGNIWITDFANGDPVDNGLYEFDRSGVQQPGFILARDVDSTQDCAYMIDDDLWVVGYYTGNYVDFYDDSGYLNSVDGPAGWDSTWGVAYSNDENKMIYVGLTDEIAYGTFTDPDTPITWTELSINAGADRVSGLGYYAPLDRTAYGRYLFGTVRSASSCSVYVWNVNDAGVPLVAEPAYILDITFFMASGGSGAGGCEWDGEHLWVLDQFTPDYILEFDLGLDDTSIEPMSLGGIKASFK